MKIKTKLKEFFNPRFTTTELENSNTRSRVIYEITSLIYDDKRQHYPTRAIGKVTTTAGSKLIVVWDQNGNCMKDGNRLPEYDIIRSTQKEIDASRPAFVALVGIFIMVIFTLIFD
jgi:hypothetical protein